MKRPHVVLCALAAGCASADPPPERPLAPEATCVEGVVASSGTELAPRTTVRPPGGAEVEVRGALATNVRLLTGATVIVCGTVPAPGAALSVRDIELRSVDGLPAHLGTISERSTGFALEPLDGGEPVRLASVPMSAQTTSEVVWVSGRTTASGALEVVSYGLLRGWTR